MDVDAGVLRSAASLADAAEQLDRIDAYGARQATEDWETANLHALASTLVQHASTREETRGSHWREDFPERDDDQWRVRLVSSLNPDGELVTTREKVSP